MSDQLVDPTILQMLEQRLGRERVVRVVAAQMSSSRELGRRLIQLEETGGQLRLLGVDVGTRGLLRRIGMERLVDGAARVVGRSLPRRLVSWPSVQLLD
mgnify:CR=1 FL=1